MRRVRSLSCAPRCNTRSHRWRPYRSQRPGALVALSHGQAVTLTVASRRIDRWISSEASRAVAGAHVAGGKIRQGGVRKSTRSNAPKTAAKLVVSRLSDSCEIRVSSDQRGLTRALFFTRTFDSFAAAAPRRANAPRHDRPRRCVQRSEARARASPLTSPFAAPRASHWSMRGAALCLSQASAHRPRHDR